VELIGAGFNHAQSNGFMDIKSDIEKCSWSLTQADFYQPSKVSETKSLVYMVRSYPKLMGKSFDLTVRKDADFVAEISGIVLQGDIGNFQAPCFEWAGDIDFDFGQLPSSVSFSFEGYVDDLKARVREVSSPEEARRLLGDEASTPQFKIFQDEAVARKNLAHIMVRYAVQPDAAAEFEQYCAVTSHDADGYLSLGRNLLASKKLTAALAVFRLVLALNPQANRVIHLTAKVLVALKRRTEALVHFESYVSHAPNDAAAFHDMGRLLTSLNRNHDAISALRTSVNLNALRGGAWLDLALISHRCGMLTQAQDAANNYIKLHPEDAARVLFVERIDSQSSHPQEKSKISKILEGLGETSSFDHFINAFRLRYPLPTSRDAGIALYKSSAKAECVSSMHTFVANLAKEPHKTEHYLGLARSLVIFGNSEEALICIRKGLEVSPTNAALYRELGKIFRTRKKFSDAAEAFGEFVKLKPSDPAGHHDFGRSLVLAGRQREAVSSFRRALVVQPDRTDAKWDLALALKFFGQWEEASQLIDEYLNEKPEAKIPIEDVAAIYLKSGRADEALKLYRQCIEQTPRKAGLRHGLASALSSLGRKQEAEEALIQEIEFNPQYTMGYLDLARLRAGG
jgi:tetratricopeptide (TPR) repeat protein